MTGGDNFVFKSSWKDLIDTLAKSRRLEIYEAVIGYAITGVIADVSASCLPVFKLIIRDLDSEREKRLRISERRKESGLKGGRGNRKPQSDFIESDEDAVEANESISKQTKTKENKEKQEKTNESKIKQKKQLLFDAEKNASEEPVEAISEKQFSKPEKSVDEGAVSLLSPTPPIISSITINSNQDLNKKETLSKEREKKKENSGGRKSRIEEFEAMCEEFMDGLEDCQMKDVFQEWLSYRLAIRKPYKSMPGIKRCYQQLCDLSYNDPDLALKIVDQSVSNEYQGLFPLRNQNSGNPQNSQYQQYSQRESVVGSLFRAQQEAEKILTAMYEDQ